MSSDSPETFSVILYGVISVTVVSLLSLGGACLGPLMTKDSKNRWLHFFLAMAISTLSSDAILHIIPQVLGVHSHSHGHAHEHHDNSSHENVTAGHGHSHHHDHDADEENEVFWYTVTSSRRNLLRLSVIVLSIYFLYFVEFFMLYRKTHLHYCAPSTKSFVANSPSSEVKSSLSNSSVVEDNNNGGDTKEKRRNSVELEKPREQGGHELISLREDDDDAGEICGLKPRALIILFGDGLHNLVDGIAIGASFMVSLKLGFITTIAVVCHELPHEIGDLAVLIDSGLSMVTALILNLISALTAYIGLFIAISLGKDEEIETILLAITAGMFLYVAWVDMLSHLKHDALMADHWMVTSILQIAGFIVGFALIFGLGWFEHLLEGEH
ncbi:CRE-TAG-141 protein [Caenorhabditis remanei]|uniref:CRE-TAG-141 protein n=1 Tax=Caenorhabditis remanei TaxID=31234 RepID=E3MK52_CAERE|nr:CRE-TAG-141 protein [Caenorhabditis remanei]